MKPEPNLMDWLQQMSERLSPLFRPEKIIAKQACFRPVTEDGLPLIGRVPRDEGLHVASGHGVWGYILNAPASGEAPAELIVEGAARNVDLTPFDPARLKPLDVQPRRSR
ncbi:MULTISPECIES: NAD(P)/FAD-dependent oxidoreductase [unclassified Bradyrhizobium]|uniref:NAD(P)/FAD-dependent oxidoreductase n=1 Tax=unclassified Bradyrhizobium TaxID=2631580 RepID=UPI00346171AD